MSGVDDVSDEVARLERENAELRAAAGETLRRRSWVRSAVAVVVAAVALVLTPVSAAAALVAVQLNDADRFVDTFAPLASDPAIQATVTEQVSTAIGDAVAPQLVGSVIQGLQSLDLSTTASAAITALEGPAERGVRAVIGDAVGSFVASDAFREVWRATLVLSHRELIAALSGATDSTIGVSADGTVSINLRPVMSAARTQLAAAGLTIVERLPERDLRITVATSVAVSQYRWAYAAAVVAGAWLPPLTVALFALSLLIAVDRRAALIRTGIAFGVVAIGVGGILASLRVFAVTRLSPRPLSAASAGVLYDTVTATMERLCTVGALIGLVVAGAAWFTGPSRRARAARSGWTHAADRVAARLGSTGVTGRVLHRYAVVVSASIWAVAAVVLWFVWPSTAGVVWTLVAALILQFALAVARAARLTEAESAGSPVPESLGDEQASGDQTAVESAGRSGDPGDQETGIEDDGEHGERV